MCIEGEVLHGPEAAHEEDCLKVGSIKFKYCLRVVGLDGVVEYGEELFVECEVDVEMFGGCKGFCAMD